MTIADLLVKLGIKGGAVVVKTLKGVGSGVLKLKKELLVLSAAMAGIVAGFRRLTGGFAKTGKEFRQLSLNTGLSIKKIQQWQFAGKTSLATSESVANSIRSLNEALAAQHVQGKPIEGFGFLERHIGFDKGKLRDTFYVLERLQKLAMKKGLDPQVVTSVMRTFGLSDDVIASMREGAFNETAFKKATLYSDEQIDNLKKMESQWKVIGDRISKSFGKLVEEWGPKMIFILEELTTTLESFLSALTKLGKIFTYGENAKAIKKLLPNQSPMSKIMEGTFFKSKGSSKSGGVVGDQINQAKEIYNKLNSMTGDSPLKKVNKLLGTGGGGLLDNYKLQTSTDALQKGINNFNIYNTFPNGVNRNMLPEVEKTMKKGGEDANKAFFNSQSITRGN